MNKFEIKDEVKYSEKYLNELHGNKFNPNQKFTIERIYKDNIVAVKGIGKKYVSYIHQDYLEKI